MQTEVSATDREFLERLHRIGPATISGLCDASGVTATAIRQRVARLEALGLVTRSPVREGRGRPRHVYSITDTARRQLGDNYSDLAQLLWQELIRIEDAPLRQRIMNRLKTQMVERFGQDVRGDSLPVRMDRLRDSLVEHGFDVEVDSGGSEDPLLPILRENSCPYHDLAHEDPAICELEQQVFSEILGADLQLTACCRDGHTCCEFEVQPG